MSAEDAVVHEGATRLLARAARSRALDASALAPRLCAVVEKYLLRHQPDAAPAVVQKFFDDLRADDMCLVVACERGDEGAWRDLIEEYTPTVRSAARAACSNETDAEELAGSVWAELYGLRRINTHGTDGLDGAGRLSGKLAYYSGCGSLGGWLRAVVAQMNVDRHRRTARFVQTEEASDLDRLSNEARKGTGGIEDNFSAVAASDPEHAFEQKETGRDLHRALARAIGELSDEDRLLIKLYYYDDLRLREAGAILGVHEATASRRLARAQKELRKETEKILREEFRWTAHETARAFADPTLHFAADGTNADLGRALMNESLRRET